MAGVWTDNWRGIKNAMLLNRCARGVSTIRRTTGTVVDNQGSARPYSPLAEYNTISYNDPTTITSYPAIVLGIGAQAPSATDYTLSGTVSLSQLSVANGIVVIDETLGKISKTVTLTVQNQNSSSVTITEWGIILGLGASGNSIGTMVYRATLDTPVTMQSYEAATFELTVEMTLDDPI